MPHDMPMERNEEYTDDMREKGGMTATELAAARKAKELHHRGVSREDILKRMDMMHPDEYLAGPLPTKGRKRAPSVRLDRR